MDHGRESNINLKELSTRAQHVQPGKMRIVINKYYIITVPVLGNKRSRPPYIRMDQLKGSGGPIQTRRIGEL